MDGDRRHSPARAVRPDIQALRAVAVALVVVFHLLPSAMPAGFVGVDAFFVISGFLITTLLIERPPTGASGLLTFWARRIRRLLPASLLVLTATVVTTWLFLPSTQWQATASQAKAAALYVVNWVLIRDAVDYLASESAPTAIQHFWSLAVEEQFYVGWPVLILLLTVLSRAGRRRTAYAAGLGFVVVASFAYSVHLTHTNPQVAYFSTWTRIWELGAGGLLAVIAPKATRRTAPALGALGWIAIATAGLAYSDKTPFPGWQAALPVGGALLVIAAQADFRWYQLRPVRWLGDVSYSVYLWHWPLIIVVPPAIARIAGGSPGRGLIDNVAIIVATLLLAGITKPFVEDRFRFPAAKPRLRSTYARAALGMAFVVVLASSLGLAVDRQRAQDRLALQRALTRDNPCLGAGAMAPRRHCAPHRGPLVPAPALAAKDLPASYDLQPNGKDCLARAARFPVTACRYGDLGSQFEVALVGNSHAAHWVPALDRIGKLRHWRITTYLAASCNGSYAVPAYDTLDISQRCVGWSKDVTATLRRDHPRLIIVATHTGRPAWGHTTLPASYPLFEAGFRKQLLDLAATKRPVVVIRDTPEPIGAGIPSVPDCIAQHLKHPTACSGRRSAWIPADPAAQAGRALSGRGVTVVDLNDLLCTHTTCFGAIGGVVAYFDGHHLSATFARTLAPYLDADLTTALRRGRT